MSATPAPARLRERAASLRLAWPEAAVTLAQLALFVPFALLRYVDGDEGAYLLEAKLVLRGELPYHDFLHTQMPLLPYVYGAWAAIFGESWLAARMLSVLFAAALGTLLYRHVATRFGTRLALFALLLYASSNLIVEWFTAVKTQPLSTLLLFAAFAVCTDAASSPYRWAGAGLLLALAVDTRLIFAAALVVFAWSARRAGAALAFSAGFVAGLAPSFLFLAVDPRRFYFGNLGYHAGRSPGGLVGDFHQKLDVAANLVGIGTPDGGIPQFLLLLLGGLAAAIGLGLLTGRLPLALWLAAVLGVASFLPTPTYAQYLSATIPFLVVAIAELAAVLSARRALVQDPRLLRTARIGLAAAAAVYPLLGVSYLYAYVHRSSDERIGDIQRVARILDEHTRPGERVLASWPGYLYGSHALPVRGMENDFAPHESAALAPGEPHRYRLATASDVERTIRTRRTRLVVFRLWHTLPPVPDWEGSLRAGGYRLLATVGPARIYIAPGA